MTQNWVAEEIEYFDRHLDETLERFYNNPHWKAYRETAEAMVSRYPAGRILDLGSGPAPSLPTLFKQAGEYVCLEPSPVHASHLRQYFPRVHVVEATAEDLSHLEIGRFDLIVCFGVLHHLNDPAVGLSRCREKLKAGGLFLAHEPSDYWNGKMGSPNERGFGRQQIRDLIEAQFRVLQFRTYHHPALRRTTYAALASVKLWPLLQSVRFWRLFCGLERGLDSIGMPGTDFLVLAQCASAVK